MSVFLLITARVKVQTKYVNNLYCICMQNKLLIVIVYACTCKAVCNQIYIQSMPLRDLSNISNVDWFDTHNDNKIYMCQMLL